MANEADDVRDPFDDGIRNSGCQTQHEQLQECYQKFHDWRKCKEEMDAFKRCFADPNRKKNAPSISAAPKNI